MYGLVRVVRDRTIVSREGVCLGIALVIAELFSKFRSFTLEAVAFLATWYLLGWCANRLQGGGPRR